MEISLIFEQLFKVMHLLYDGGKVGEKPAICRRAGNIKSLSFFTARASQFTHISVIK